MKIKHFSGYGCVRIKKIDEQIHMSEYAESQRVIVIEVIGNHERGLEPRFFDARLVHEWLGRRFTDKTWLDLTDYSVLRARPIDGEDYVIYKLFYKEEDE